MKKVRSLKNIYFIFIIALVGLIITGTKASAELTIKANHDHIKIDFFYHGSTVSVAGTADPGADLIIKIASPEGPQALRKKGKAAGFLWMNVGNIEFEHVPNLYFLHSAEKIDELLDQDEMDNYPC